MKKIVILILASLIGCCPGQTVDENPEGRYVWLDPGETVIDSTTRAECVLAILESEKAREVIKENDEKGEKQKLLTKIKFMAIGYGIGTVSVLIYFIARGK